MMRLEIVESGHNSIQKEQFEKFKAKFEAVSDSNLVLSYRRDIFGKYFSACCHEAMRLSAE